MSLLLSGRVVWHASRVVWVVACALVGQTPLAARTFASCPKVWVAAGNASAEDWLLDEAEVVWEGRTVLLVVLDRNWVICVCCERLELAEVAVRLLLLYLLRGEDRVSGCLADSWPAGNCGRLDTVGLAVRLLLL